MSTQLVHDHMAAIAPASIATRSELAAIKRELRSGALPVSVAMQRPALAHIVLADVIRWIRGTRGRGGSSLELIGRAAVRDGVNLLIPVGRASERSKTWVAENAYRHWRPSR